MRALFVISLLLSYWVSFAQTPVYILDIKDHTTYDTTCGKTTGSYWGTINDTCELTTTPFVVGSSCGDTNFTNVPVELRINQSGNLECDDLAVVEYQCGGSSSWQHLDTIRGCEQTSNSTYNYNVPCANGDSFSIKVKFNNNDTTEKWQIRDGDLIIYDACVLLPMYVLSFSMQQDEGNPTFKMTLNEAAEKDPILQFSTRGEDFIDLGSASYEGENLEGYNYIWELLDKPKSGFYRVKFGQGEYERYTEVIEFEREILGLPSIKFLGTNRLQVSNLEGLAKVFITSLSGEKVEEFQVMNSEEEIELSANLHGLYVATLYARDEYQTIKFMLR